MTHAEDSSRRCKISCLSSKNTDVVDQTFDQLLVVMWLTTEQPSALVEDGVGIQLNLELVLLFHLGLENEMVSIGRLKDRGGVGDARMGISRWGQSTRW